jgi:RsiW-degrading membrane proteinase PrsW (M82 family)
VAGAEESSKYLLLRRRTWHSPEFNCQYDGVVYAVFVALPFAASGRISATS